MLDHGEHVETGCSCRVSTESLIEEFSVSAGGKGTRILIVDDTENMRLLLSRYLDSLGYFEILTASSANEAFKHLMADPEVPASDAVDLILMDINMPGLDGIEACRQIKGDMGLVDIPVIMVTSDIDPEHLKRAFDAGAMDYITTPFNGLELRVRVASALKVKHALDAQKRVNALLEEKNLALIEAVENVKVLLRCIPSAPHVKGSLNVLEGYIAGNFEADFSQGICQDC